MPFYSHKQLHNPVPRKSIIGANKLDALLGNAPPTNPATPLSAGALEAKRLLAEAQKKYEQQQQEKQTVSDIKTALATALAKSQASKSTLQETIDQWADDDSSLSTSTPTQPEPATMNTPTAPTLRNYTSVSEQTFNFVRDNPYITVQAAIKTLTDMGLKENSTGSLLYQMIRCGMLSRDKDDRLTALQKKYTPVQTKRNATKLRKKTRALRTPRTEPVVLDLRASTRQDKAEGIAALNAPVAQPTPATVTATPLMTAEQVLKTLSVKEAHALYRELQTMFG